MTDVLETNTTEIGEHQHSVRQFKLDEQIFRFHETIITEADVRQITRIEQDQILVYSRDGELEVILEEDVEVILSEDKPLHLRTKPRPLVLIDVNCQPVKIHHGRRTGLQIKAAAIEQGVQIKLDFTLSLEGHGEPDRVIGDHDHVLIKGGEDFLAVDPHENS